MIVGIDLGTTNSLIALWHNGQSELIPNALGDLLTPSVVGMAEDGQLLVGRAARDQLSTAPLRTAATFKRYMGTARETTLGTRSFRPEELSAMVLRSLKADAEAHLRQSVSDAVITVPAYFNDAQRKATKVAGELAGFKVDRLLTEPTAAALAYGVGRPSTDELVLVVDLGGGTFDVSLLHMFEGITEVRAAAGDTWLGGEDFVDVLVDLFMKAVGEAAGVPTTSTAPARAALRRQAEIAKRRLSDADEAVISVAHQERLVDHVVTRAEFERAAEPLLARLRFPIERALRDARVEPDRVARVILAGGASRMPMFRRLIGRIFRRLPLQSINPEEVVALGAAVRAGMLSRATDLVETIMTDVAPFTLGIEVNHHEGDAKLGGIFLPIIERNTVIPASRVKRVFNSENDQAVVGVTVYQGESLFVQDNIELGKLSVPIPRSDRGKQPIDIRFTYDPSGLLEVESHVISTDIRRTLVIEGNPGVLTPPEIATRLAQLSLLKVHPREQSENRALLARGKRLYEERLGPARHDIGEALAGFEAALVAQDPDRIQRARKLLEVVIGRHADDEFL
jgi:molecular chaperone HscC